MRTVYIVRANTYLSNQVLLDAIRKIREQIEEGFVFVPPYMTLEVVQEHSEHEIRTEET